MLLGAEILFSRILAIGLPGIYVAWVVTPIVLITAFWFGQKIVKIPSKTLNITVSADMSVCGVSAAIATGAVAAAGAFLGERVLSVAATVRMIQNILIGLIAFGVAVHWCTKVERGRGQQVGSEEIWDRCPKFVLGFIGASIVFSVLYVSMGEDAGYTMIRQGVMRGLSSGLRGWFFCLAFVSIGLATNFRELAEPFRGGKPLILYVCGQGLNLILTLTMAYIMFFVVFPKITEAI